MGTVDSASDDRTVNNTMRHQYRGLNDAEKADMQRVKDMGLALVEFLDELQKKRAPREMALAKTKVEEAVMWAVKGITA